MLNITSNEKFLRFIIVVLTGLSLIGVFIVFVFGATYVAEQRSIKNKPTEQTVSEEIIDEDIIDKDITTALEKPALEKPAIEKPALDQKIINSIIQNTYYTTANNNFNMTKQEVFEKNNVSIVSVTTDFSSGSGVIVHEDGYILTNEHVIDGQNSCYVSFLDNKSSEILETLYAEVVHSNIFKDLALLKVESSKKLPYVNICLSENVKVGDDVCAIGNPQSLNNTLTFGLVSAIRYRDNREEIQTDANITFGSSGGGLFNMSAELIGITTSTLDVGGFGFAVSSKEIIDFLDSYDPTYVENLEEPYYENKILEKEALQNDNPTYVEAVNNILNDYGHYDFKMNIHQIFRFDIDNDSIDEVFINARTDWKETHQGNQIANVLFMRKLVDNEVRNFVVPYNLYSNENYLTGYDYMSIEILNFYDFDHDGVAEVLLSYLDYDENIVKYSTYKYSDTEFFLLD